MPATVTQASTSGVSTHHIDWGGIAGAMFWLVLAALVLFVVGFATPGWSVRNNSHLGLWESCNCGNSTPDESWFKATQAMAILGLIGLTVSCVLGFLYMFVHRVSKMTTLIVMTILLFLSVIFMLIAFILFGTNRDNQSYSFAFCVIASIMTLAAGVLSLYQLIRARN